VSDERLACLYTGALAAVSPSLAEGFGLPAVEAAACGAPAVLSDLPAHRETLGKHAMYFPPRDAKALASALDEVMTNEARRAAMAAGGRQAVARLSWDAGAQRLLEVLLSGGASRQ
jgi:glycosyltransferase involved in cell wall biosynthesis